jgi:release factor glutamine methyltransferase
VGIYINILELYQIGINELVKNEIETPKIDARAILEHILGVDFGKLSLHYYENAEPVKDEYLSKIKLRCENMPLSYITNKKEFFSLPFYVREGALIPRAETENLVQVVLDYLAEKEKTVERKKVGRQRLENAVEECLGEEFKPNYTKDTPLAVADLCSGSGCIGISVALSKSKNLDVAVDLYEFSDDALEISKINKENLGAENVTILKRDLLAYSLDRNYDVIVANPPYIPKVELPTLMSEVKDYEPEMALTDGEDGNLFYRRIAQLSLTHLNKGGILAVEVGINQHHIVKNIFVEILGNEKNIKIINDYFGIERVVLYEAN